MGGLGFCVITEPVLDAAANHPKSEQTEEAEKLGQE